ncbi:23S rRNA (uracil-5-)-methyltransferase RumA [Anaerocolumna cellulosilytica]|uniref:23S rRNA (Uracil-5-)-methyltransferase RumA n=1 Tax=Anaerocolumna cellulosilytica TaxID=433286 RepID=A0A6S6QR09_9FIRM|nr:23S rRNA (uracil(1939)-C(5))-methyltransferase RlmD [Anaerocolumna cellulosilytica]MBB5195532.1 23S rRNA (uracil1939-C5)-methyltransferase [Anaerocolumna cellulosilytica]BCJ93773.1 23S rRNA (uracil-5-)-methyltransferase RumA [Anaerocolumna cellulosilytica]
MQEKNDREKSKGYGEAQKKRASGKNGNRKFELGKAKTNGLNTCGKFAGENKKDKSAEKNTRKSFDKTGSKDNKNQINKDNPKFQEREKSIKNRNTGNKTVDKNRKTGKDNANKSKCPVLYKCGGCQLLHLEYPKQLKEKQTRVEALLKKFGKVEPIIGMKNPLHYRNKVHAAFDHDRKGNPISGIYESGTHNIVPIDSCLIENEKADAIIVSIRGLLKSFKIKTYDEDTGYGLLRHVLIRTGHSTGEIMVVLVISSPIFPSKNNFVKALRKIHPDITTIVVNVNNKKTSMILGEKEQTIYGKGFIEDTLCEKVFRISPKSFYQVNPVQTEILYGKAIELAACSGKEIIVDAYCGIGTIGIIASGHVKKVIGVELNQDAVRDAVMNAKRNDISNIDFYNKDAGEFMTQLAEQGQPVDLVFMDPPRAGSDEKFLTSLVTLAPKKVVYISCNPETLARDLEFITKKGYRCERIVPVDMFPGTGHVETCVLLSHKNLQISPPSL